MLCKHLKTRLLKTGKNTNNHNLQYKKLLYCANKLLSQIAQTKVSSTNYIKNAKNIHTLLTHNS